MRHAPSPPALSLALAAAMAALGGCLVGGQNTCKKDPITGSEQCQPVSSNGGEAAATAAVAAASWSAVGCSVNDCAGPYRCNPKTKRCDPLLCSDDDDRCPAPYLCDLQRGRCE